MGKSKLPFNRDDRHFHDVLDASYGSGLSRDEISLRDASGLIEFANIEEFSDSAAKLQVRRLQTALPSSK
jgi:hypothetical protein